MWGWRVSLRRVAVCVVDAEGKTLPERSVDGETHDITQWVVNVLTRRLRIGFEAGAVSESDMTRHRGDQHN